MNESLTIEALNNEVRKIMPRGASTTANSQSFMAKAATANTAVTTAARNRAERNTSR